MQEILERNHSKGHGRSSCGPLALGVCQARAEDSDNPNESTDRNVMNTVQQCKGTNCQYTQWPRNLTDTLSKKKADFYQRAHSVWFSLSETLEKTSLTIVTEIRSVLIWSLWWKLGKSTTQPFGVTEMFFTLAVVSWVHIFVRPHENVPCKWTHFIAWIVP